MQLSCFLVAAGALLRCASALDPWYFTWTDPSNETHSESGSEPNTCTAIDNPVGKYFDWAAGDGWCIYFWETTNCTGGTEAGYTCKTWPWRANATYHHLRAFKAVVNGTDWETSPSSTSISASTNTATSTPTNDAQPSDDSGSKSLTGGAITGIVLGVLAGVAIFAVAAWFFSRKQKKTSTMETHPPDTSDIGDKELTVTQEAQQPGTMINTTAELPEDSEKKCSELAGDDDTVEMSDTHRVVELDATETSQRQI